jgi:hypothetical protein
VLAGHAIEYRAPTGIHSHDPVGGFCGLCGSPWPCSAVRRGAVGGLADAVGPSVGLMDGRTGGVDSSPLGPSPVLLVVNDRAAASVVGAVAGAVGVPVGGFVSGGASGVDDGCPPLVLSATADGRSGR